MSLSKTYILADFDGTLTQAYMGTTKRPSLISVLRDYDYLGDDYATAAKVLYAKYSPLEDDTSRSFQQRKDAMEARRGEHLELLIKKGLNTSHLQRIINEGHIQMRAGYQEFFEYLHTHQIPTIIISASGLGTSMIQMMLEHSGVDMTHIHIISNQLVFDDDGFLQSVQKPYIHTLNKDETEIKSFGFDKKIAGRDQIILLGDKLGDLLMARGASYSSLVSFGFLNDPDASEEAISMYEEGFDKVITGDGSLDDIVGYLSDNMID